MEVEMSKNEISNGNIIVLVGAGASMSIGIPTMKKMVGKYRAQIEEGSLAAQGLEILDRAKVDSDLEETLYEINRIQETPNSGAFRALVHTKGGSAKIQHSDQEIAHIKKATQTLQRYS